MIQRSNWADDLFAEGAHAFITEIRPFLDQWQEETEGYPRMLQIGEPEGLPPDIVFEYLKKEIEERDKNPSVWKYGPMGGPPQFQEEFANHARRFGMVSEDIPPTHVLFTSGGSKQTYNMFAKEIASEGTDVLVLRPGYPGQLNAAMGARGKIHSVPVRPDNNWSTDADELDAVLNNHKPKVLYLCDPQNPTGGVLDEDSIYKIANYLYNNPDVTAIMDYIYYGHLSDKKAYTFLSSIPEIAQQVVVVAGASKILKATGDRAGVGLIPRQQTRLRDGMIKRINAENAGPSPFLALALAEGYKKEMDTWIEANRLRNAQKRDVVVEAARQYRPDFSTNIPPGAFYLIGDLPIDGRDFAFLAARFTGTAILHANVFGGGEVDAEGNDLGGDTKKRIRISFAGKLDETVGGIDRLGHLAMQIGKIGPDEVEKRIVVLKEQHGDDWVNHVHFIKIIPSDPGAPTPQAPQIAA